MTALSPLGVLARPGERPRKLFDGDGPCLSVSPTGHKAWRFKYYLDGNEKHLQFGRYPEITFKVARDRRLEVRRALEMGQDPGAVQKAERLARSATFEALATEWLEVQRNKLTPKTFDNKRERFAAFVFPYLGKRPIAEIKALDMLDVLKRIEEAITRSTQRCAVWDSAATRWLRMVFAP